jgi:hypothetical protein
MRLRRSYFTTRQIFLTGSLLVLVFASGCSSQTYPGTSDRPGTLPTPRTSSGVDASSVSGVWQGTTLATCAAFVSIPSRCNAEQKVTIRLTETPGGGFTGTYSCAYGNMDCYDANYSGKVIAASVDGSRLSIRVLMPDATSCVFSGTDTDQNINGGYTCYQGGTLIEQGTWQAHRSY